MTCKNIDLPSVVPDSDCEDMPPLVIEDEKEQEHINELFESSVQINDSKVNDDSASTMVKTGTEVKDKEVNDKDGI